MRPIRARGRDTDTPSCRSRLDVSCAAEAAVTPPPDASHEETTPEAQGRWHGRHAVVVGAGPAGALAALLLAGNGFRVDVFESGRVQQQQGAGGVHAYLGPRSYDIALSKRQAA
jgi:NADPH-dependent 2,4-dienoyl-CoA reductase/sulfur reductase-like enzyme